MDPSTPAPSSPAAGMTTDFISYPSAEAVTLIPSTSGKPAKKATVEDRLYIGGLHPSVDEVTLWKLLKDYGPDRIDFPVHLAGTLQGRSRGFAFVHFHTKEAAARALSALHGRLLRKQTLSVSYAVHNPNADLPAGSGPHRTTRRSLNDATKQTVLSRIKSKNQPSNTNASIAMLEAKLNRMKEQDEREAKILATSETLRHPLPMKPVVQHPAAAPTLTLPSTSVLSHVTRPSSSSSPGLSVTSRGLAKPLPLDDASTSGATSVSARPPTTTATKRSRHSSTLIGVKLKKSKS